MGDHGGDFGGGDRAVGAARRLRSGALFAPRIGNGAFAAEAATAIGHLPNASWEN